MSIFKCSGLLLSLLLLLITLCSCSSDDNQANNRDLCWVLIDGQFMEMYVTTPAEYIDGGEEGLAHNALSEIRYPAEARENSIQGRVVVQFEITAEGRVKNITTMEEIGGGCDEESVRVIREISQGISFIPAEIDGVKFSVRKNIPINFKLE